MSAESLELMIEGAWLKLERLSREEARTVYLARYQNGAWTISGACRSTRPATAVERCEVGTYSGAATLQQFREDVFFVFDQMQGRKAA